MSVEGGWGPTVGGGRSRGRVLGRVLGLVLVVTLLVFGLLGAWLYAQISREQVDGLAGGGGPRHVLVVGTDAREHLTREEQRELGVGGVGGERADTIFVMTIRGGEAAMLAFPRDLWVERCDGSTGRINVAIEAGAGCMVETVRDLSGLDIQHFVRVTFGGFRDVVDAVGGVELCLEEAIADDDAHIDLPAGCQVLDGRDALGYVRVRKIDDDLARIGRQQEFLQALSREVTTPSTLFNPWRLYRLGDEAGDAVTIDDDTGPLGLLRLARGGRGLADGGAPAYTVPGTPGQRGQAAVLLMDEVAAEQVFARFRDGSVLREARAGVSPGDVQVAVRNAAGVSGLAGQVAEVLDARGYEVVDIGNAEQRDDTLVQHPPGELAAAELLASDVPGDVTLEESRDVPHLVLLLGPRAAGAS